MERPLGLNSVRIGGLRLPWPGRRRLDRKLRVGRQYARAGGIGRLAGGRVARLFGAFELRTMPSIANQHDQHTDTDQRYAE